MNGASAKQEQLDIVTGAFSHTGRYIAARLLRMGRRVRTITGHPERPHSFGSQIEAFPFCFDDLGGLAHSMEGADTLYNTYWIRFPRRGATFADAVANTGIIVEAAKEAGVHRIVHLSVMHPSLDSPLDYFGHKAQAEELVVRSGMPYTIVRPGVIFGPEDVFVNNIAWMLRRLPVFALPGRGDYGVQPIFVDDVAGLCIDSAVGDNAVLDAVGPEIYSFEEFIALIEKAVGSRTRILRVPPLVALAGSKLIGAVVRDVVLTRQELDGLMAGLCVSNQPATGWTSFKAWLADNGPQIGLRWASQLQRHYTRNLNDRRDRSKATK